MAYGFLEGALQRKSEFDERKKQENAAKNLVKKVDIGLNKGKSWESISKDTGVPLSLVKQYSEQTRPGYGIKKPEDNRNLLQKTGDFLEESNKAFMGSALGGLADATTFATGKLTGVSDKDIAAAQKDVRSSIGVGDSQGLTPLEKFGKTPEQIRQEIIKNRTDFASRAGRVVGAGQGIIADVATTIAPAAAAEKVLRGTQIANRFLQGGKLAKVAGEAGISVGSGAAATAASILKDPTQLTAENVGTNTAIDAALGAATPFIAPAIKAVRGIGKKGVADGAETLSKAAQESKAYKAYKDAENSIGSFKVSKLQKVMDTVRREAFDRNNYFVRADRFEVKQAGRSLDDQRAAGESLTDLVGKFHAIDSMSEIQLNKKFGKNSIADFIKKDGVDTPAAVSRNQFINDMFDQEVRNANRNKKGIATKMINRNVDDAALAQRIEEYKMTHDDWEDSLKVSKGLMDDFLDTGVAHKILNKDVAEFVKKRYKTAAPIERLFDDEVIRPEIRGGMQTNLGRDKILQSLEGSDAPVNLGYDRFLNRTRNAMLETVKNDLSREIRRRGESKTLIGGYKTLISPEKTMRFEALKNLRDQANASMKTAKSQLSKKTGQLRVQNAFTAPLRREASKLTREVLAGSDDEAVRAAAENLTDKQALDIFTHITGDAGVDALRGKIIKSKAGQQTQNLLDEITGLKEQYAQAKSQSQEAFNGMVDNRQANATNVNQVAGFEQGYKFKGEINPQLAKSLEQVSSGKSREVLKALNIPSASLKVFWTRANPIFNALRTVYEPVLMGITSKANPLDLVDPRTIKLAFSKQFGKDIYSSGAIREGVTSTARDTQSSARAIAAEVLPTNKRNIANIIDFATKDPKTAASKVSEVMSLYSNALRRWSSAGTYRRFLRQYNDEGKALNVAVHDYNEVLGNFQRASDSARAVEAVLPYTVAGQAGARQLGKAARERPKETAARLLAFMGAVTMGANSLMDTPEGQEYAKEQYETERSLNVDGFITLPLPGGPRRNVDKDGKVTWDNIVKIKIPPDFRPAAAIVNRAMLGAKTGDWKELDAGLVASSAFGTASGGLLLNQNTGRVDPENALKSGTASLGMIASGVDPETRKPLTETNWNPSDSAKKLSGLTGGKLSPEQADALLTRMGALGSVAKKGDPVSLVDSIKNQTVRTKSKSPRSVWQEDATKVSEGKEQVNERVNKLIRKSGGDEGKELSQADKLAYEFNQKVDKLLKRAKSNKDLSMLSKKQIGWLEGLKFPMEGKYIKQSSIDSRLE